MDLAGIAALLGVPVALVTALLPLRDRAVLTRLERIDKLLRDTDLDAQHAELLRMTRRSLVRRVAVAELDPGQGPFGWVLLGLNFVFIVYIGAGALSAVVKDAHSLDAVLQSAAVLLLLGSFVYAATAGHRNRRKKADGLFDRRDVERNGEPPR